MIEIGRICVKLAGRDAGKKAVIVDILDEKFVLIDGQTRRRKCNILHIEPLSQTIKIGKNASHDEVTSAFKELGIEARQTKPKQPTVKPTKKRKTPEQIRAQKEEKRKLKDIKPKKKEEKAQEKTEKTEDIGTEAKKLQQQKAKAQKKEPKAPKKSPEKKEEK